MGSVVISLDAELAWGFHDQNSPPVDRIESARRGWWRLLELFDRYDVPATWAVVGHLFLEECDGIHETHPAPPGWFDGDPGTDRETDPDWYGRDLIEAIRNADVDHEIGCHSFSHVEFGAPDTTRELADAEVRVSVEAAEEMGVSLRSFVFPRNVVGNRAVLSDNGILCYRRRRARPIDRTPLRLPWKGVETAIGRSPPLVQPEIDEYGLVAIPPSIDLFGFEGRVRSLLEPVTDEPVLRRVERGVDDLLEGDDDLLEGDDVLIEEDDDLLQGDDATLARDDLLHIWFHPNDLTTPEDVERVRRLLSHIDRRRSDGVTVETMGAVARRVLAQADGDEG